MVPSGMGTRRSRSTMRSWVEAGGSLSACPMKRLAIDMAVVSVSDGAGDQAGGGLIPSSRSAAMSAAMPAGAPHEVGDYRDQQPGHEDTSGPESPERPEGDRHRVPHGRDEQD